MANNEKTSVEVHQKRTHAVKEIVTGVIKFCVGSFFGAAATYIMKDSKAPKFERYSIIAGGAMVGLYVGGQASEQVCLRIDSISDRMLQIQNSSEEEK